MVLNLTYGDQILVSTVISTAAQRHLLDVLDDLQGDVLQAAPQLGHLGAQRGHAGQHLVQTVPQLQLLLRGQALNHGLHRRQSLLLGHDLWRREGGSVVNRLDRTINWMK